METLVLAALLNPETADHGPQSGTMERKLHARPSSSTGLEPQSESRCSIFGSAVRGLPSFFITYAVEIEGAAPLVFFAEAVDD